MVLTKEYFGYFIVNLLIADVVGILINIRTESVKCHSFIYTIWESVKMGEEFLHKHKQMKHQTRWIHIVAL